MSNFYNYIKSSPRSNGSDVNEFNDLPFNYDDFFENCIGSFITFTRNDIKPTKKKKVNNNNNNSRRLRRFSVDNIFVKHPFFYKNVEEISQDVLFMKVIIGARSDNLNTSCMIRVYNTDGVNIIDKWMTEDRTLMIISKWLNMYPNTNQTLKINDSDQFKNYLNLDEINDNDEVRCISPRSPRELNLNTKDKTSIEIKGVIKRSQTFNKFNF